jgi:glutamyl-tRNA reductase
MSRIEQERFGRRLAALSPEQRAIVADLARSIIQKVLHTPIVSLKSAAEHGEAGARVALYREIFGLDRELPDGEDSTEETSGPTHVIQGGKED